MLTKPCDESFEELKKDFEKESNEAPISLDQPSPPQITNDVFIGWPGEMIDSVSKATETPMELPAMMVLAVLSACCQKKFVVEPEEGYRKPLNVWALVALDSGTRKSSVMKIIKAPILQWEREQAEKLNPEIQKAMADRKTLEEQIKIMRKDAANLKNNIEFEDLQRQIAKKESELPDIKSIPRIWAQDITPENLGVIMAQNEERISIFSAEGGIFEIMAGMYSKKGIANIDVFLQSHAGDAIRVDRGSREPVFMSAPTLIFTTSKPLHKCTRGCTRSIDGV